MYRNYVSTRNSRKKQKTKNIPKDVYEVREEDEIGLTKSDDSALTKNDEIGSKSDEGDIGSKCDETLDGEEPVEFEESVGDMMNSIDYLDEGPIPDFYDGACLDLDDHYNGDKSYDNIDDDIEDNIQVIIAMPNVVPTVNNGLTYTFVTGARRDSKVLYVHEEMCIYYRLWNSDGRYTSYRCSNAGCPSRVRMSYFNDILTKDKDDVHNHVQMQHHEFRYLCFKEALCNEGANAGQYGGIIKPSAIYNRIVKG